MKKSCTDAHLWALAAAYSMLCFGLPVLTALNIW